MVDISHESCSARRHRTPETSPLGKATRDERAGPLACRTGNHFDHRRAGARSRQADAVALHRVRRRRPRSRRRGHRKGVRAKISAGASAMNMVTAASALGYGACWLTGWFAFDRDVLDGLGLKAHEKLAGFIHIGTQTKPNEDRPRPALGDIVTRF